jgi:hypothetical protein
LAFNLAACCQRFQRELDVLLAQVGDGRRRRGLEARVWSAQSAVLDPMIVGEVNPIKPSAAARKPAGSPS